MRLNWFAEASQGSRSSFSSQTPVLTGLNGRDGLLRRRIAESLRDRRGAGGRRDVERRPGQHGGRAAAARRDVVRRRWTVALRSRSCRDSNAPTAVRRDAAPPAAVAAGKLAVAAAGAGPAKSHDEGELRIASSDPAEASPRASPPGLPPLERAAAESGAESLAEMAAKKGHEQAAGDAEGQDFLAKGKQAEAAGKLGAAKAYYRMGLEKASGALLSELQTRLDAVLARQ